MMNPKDMVREGYDQVSRTYRGDRVDSEDASYYRRCMDLLLPHLAPRSRILDLGCGCGIPTARDLAPQHAVTGVDFSQVQIARARTHVPSAEFLCADMTEVGFPPDQFDVIVSLYAIIHVPLEEQPALFRKISTWLKPNGWLLCVVGHREWTGTEEDWLGVQGCTMYWSHADEQTYERWLKDLEYRIARKIFLPEDGGGHTAFLAQRAASRTRRGGGNGSQDKRRAPSSRSRDR